MNLICQSANFLDCPAAGCELSLERQRHREFLLDSKNYPQISDALILNTCNRLEFYFYCSKKFDISGHIDNFVSVQCWKKHKKIFFGIEAAAHLFSVAGGLESQIIGENEIFAQLKSAYSFALRCETINFVFHHLMHSAFRVAKAVRTHTNISTGVLSTAGAAVRLAAEQRAIGKAKVFVIGSGANAELVIKHLIKKKVGDITLVARNFEAASQLIEKTSVKFLHLSKLKENLHNADIIFAATASQEPLIATEHLNECGHPLVLIDLSVPPNIEPEAARVSGIKLFNMKSLNEIISRNNIMRKNEVPRAKAVINSHLPAFTNWYENLKMEPAVR